MLKTKFRRTKSTLKNPAVWSNFFWLIPAVVALYYGNVFLAIPALVVVTTSTLYHLSYNRYIEYIDEIFAGLYILVGPFLLWKVGFPSPGTEIAILAIVAGLVTFLYSHRILRTEGWNKYRKIHKWWHISSAGSAAVIYMTYFSVMPI